MGRFDSQSMIDSEYAKKLVKDLETFITYDFASSREQSLALTRLEELHMWIGKMIRDAQLKRNE